MSEEQQQEAEVGAEQQPADSRIGRRDLNERQLSAASFFNDLTSQQATGSFAATCGKATKPTESEPSSAGSDPTLLKRARDLEEKASLLGPAEGVATRPALKPPLPPPPSSRDLVQKPSSKELPKTKALTSTCSFDISSPLKFRRHAIQEQSLERDAAISLKLFSKEHGKSKRTSSIKNALRHASHLATPLKSHAHLHHRSHKGGSGGGSGSAGSKAAQQENDLVSMPHESLFEPPVTQRAFQRSRRRDAMLAADPKRQLSADTIKLRQLTDEYLQNAGVKPLTNQCSLVALSGPINLHQTSSATSAGVGVPGGGQAAAASGSIPISANSQFPALVTGEQPACSIETIMYQASKQSSSACQNQDLAKNDFKCQVVVLPGNLPWQSDVCIQCELLQGPSIKSCKGRRLNSDGEEQENEEEEEENSEYESTGDILKTIAGPFRGSNLQLATCTAGANASSSSTTSDSGNHHLEAPGTVSATLKRGLSAISQHHLSPAAAVTSSAALQVVGNLKKSFSNTLDISSLACSVGQSQAQAISLHSQDSLPAYSSFQNEPDEEATSWPPTTNGPDLDTMEAAGQGGLNSNSLIGQLASKLGRKSSKKFTSSKKGLQRALSFDCRGYKRLQGVAAAAAAASAHQSQAPKSPSNQPLVAARQRANNKSAHGLDSIQAPRPYLPQSASQVDFQVPLLPYHKMQEAIVSQRLLEPPPPAAAAQAKEAEQANGAQAKEATNSLDADQLICAPSTGSALLEAQTIHQQQQREEMRAQPEARRSTAPKLVLDIPTIQTSASTPKDRRHLYPKEVVGGEEASALNEDEKLMITCLPSPNVSIIDQSFNCQLLAPAPGAGLSQSPSFCIDPQNKSMLAAGQNLSACTNQLSANDVFSQRAQNLIKRPSTMVVGDEVMSQVAKALSGTSSGCKLSRSTNNSRRNRRQAIVPPKLATDATNSDHEEDHSGPEVGQLVDVDDNDGERQDTEARGKFNSCNNQPEDDLLQVRAHRRKRSGGGERKMSQGQRAATTSPLPTFRIEPTAGAEEEADLDGRPVAASGEEQQRNESRASTRTVDCSIVSSESSSTLSSFRHTGNNNNEFTVTSPGGLTISFNSSTNSKGGGQRRRSSIAVIPQMQICPGDLLVYSKQLIDRMNQTEDQPEPPPFLTIDDKKGKNNIWSSLKLCAQFDNRTIKARNELLCSLEDVLASLQPSTFIDEQLSHYKGMLWNEFLYETESRRSASSEEGQPMDQECARGLASQVKQRYSAAADLKQLEPIKALDSAPAGIANASGAAIGNQGPKRESLKLTMSSGSNLVSAPSSGAQQAKQPPGSATQTPVAGGGGATNTSQRTIGSRFKEKPKLKRGQTVDFVFRIPLIPSSPLKHASQHQQTPTAHLEQIAASNGGGGKGLNGDEDDDDLLTINDDDEHDRCSMKSSTTTSTLRDLSVSKHNRTSSTRSTRGFKSSRERHAHQLDTIGDSQDVVEYRAANSVTVKSSPAPNQNLDSSFEIDDAMDLMGGNCPQQQQPQATSERGAKFTRQSSLSTLSSTITRTEQKRQRALWDLFQSECTFFFDHLLTLKNVYMEPLKKIQVEGFAMFADPDVLFGNLDELCCGVYDFCKEFLYIIMRTLKTRPEELNATDVLIKLYKKNPKSDHLRGVYHRYTLNYINALTYLESLRKQVEFVEFEKWSSRDVRCKKLQLTDLLVAPVQHIMRVPIILRDIESHTENLKDRDEIRAILAVEEASLRELDDKMRWLKNFERLLEIQKNINWPSVIEMDSKLFIPEFLKEVLSKQPCERLIVSPRRQIVHEGTLSNLDAGKPSDMHVILFDDMLLLTRRKKGLTKKTSTVCKSNSGGSSNKDDGSFKYIVYKQPLSLDRFYVHDVQQVDAQSIGLKHLFLLIIMNRFQQINNIHSFCAPNDDIKQTWLFKIKKTAERWKKNFSNSSSDQQQQQQQLAVKEAPLIKQPQQIAKPPKFNDDSMDRRRRSDSHSIREGTGQRQQTPSIGKLSDESGAKRNQDSAPGGHSIELIVTSASGGTFNQNSSDQISPVAQPTGGSTNASPT